MARPSDQALVASQSSPQAVSTEGFDPSREFRLKAWDVTVHGYGTERINAASRGKALAEAWRCDAFNSLRFGDFLKIASAWRAMFVPAGFGEAILVDGKRAYRVGERGQYVAFAWPGSDTVLLSHPSEVVPAIATEARRAETSGSVEDEGAAPTGIAQ